MGLLVDGKWRDAWYDTEKTGGKFVRQVSQFRHWITPDGAAGPSGSDGFAAETGRYHLYVSLSLPVGAPDTDLQGSQGPEGSDFAQYRRSFHGSGRLDILGH